MSVDGELPVKIDVREGRGEDGSYKYSFTYERATLYEFKFDRKPKPDPKDPCFRCYRRVRPSDQVNVGALFHKQCFRCRICGLPLTQQTFHRNDANGSTDKEVYCKSHVGKLIDQVRYERQPLDLENALPSPGYVIQIPGENKNLSRSSSPKPVPSPRNSPRASPKVSRATPPNINHFQSTPRTNNLPESSLVSVTPMSNYNDISSFMPTHPSLDYSTMSATSYLRPRPPLQSFSDFETSGVFYAQSILEQRHREEEERLQRFLLEEREKEMRKLDETIGHEKERAASELLASFEHMSLSGSTPNLMAERERIEEHFRRMREDKLKGMMDKISSEEKTRTAKMLDRHGYEMMLLISEKDKEFDRTAIYDHSMKPAIIPPETKKAELYKSPEVFEHLDKRAIECAGQDYVSFTDLIKDLTRDCESELEKARVIFRWVIAKDLSKHNVNEIIRPNMQAMTLLKGIRSGKETYHQLFKKLCNFAGLHCEIILGYSKGAGYKPGMKMDSGTFRNSWTAVAIDGNWRFVNCTWAARHVTGHKDNLPEMFHKYDEFYFLTDPEDYIYQHYPDDSSWQLIDIPLPFSEFISLPVVKSPFFNYGLRFYSNYGGTLTTDTGMVEVRVVASKILGFGSLLESFDKSVESRLLEGRVLLRHVKNEVIFTVNLPRRGLYYFSIYTGDYWHSECLESACSFLVNCTRIVGDPAPAYPPVPFYGPTPVMEDLKISCENQLDPLIISNGQNMEIIFKLDKDNKITHTFQFYDTSDESVTDIDRYVFLRSRTDTNATYLIRCPRDGYYIFSLYASGSDKEGQTLDCAYRYLIINQEANPNVTVFPKTYHRWQRCTLHEPVSGDLMTNKRYMFRLDVPQAVEVFLVIGEIWYHLKRKLGFTWEANINTGKNTGTAKVYARFTAERDASIFAHLLDFELVDDGETEI